MDSKEAFAQFLETFAAEVRAETLAEVHSKLDTIGGGLKAPPSAGYMTALAAIRGHAAPLLQERKKPGPKPKLKALPPAMTLSRPVAHGKRKMGAKRDRSELERLEKGLVEWFSDNPGTGSGAAAKSLGVKTADLVLPLKVLKKKNIVKQKGDRGGATYTVR